MKPYETTGITFENPDKIAAARGKLTLYKATQSGPQI